MRTVLPRTLAALLAVSWGWLFFGLQDLTVPFVDRDLFYRHLVTETGWGLLFLVLVGVPLLAYAARPSALLLAEVEVVAVALALGALVALSPRHLLPAGVLLLTTEGVRRLARTPRPDLGRPELAWVVVLALSLPWLEYAVRMARATRLREETWNLDHYPVQAALGFALLLLAALTAYGEGQPGRLLVGLTVATSAVWLGAISLQYPTHVGSLGTAGGWLSVVWGLLVLVTLAWVTVPRRRVAPPARPALGGP